MARTSPCGMAAFLLTLPPLMALLWASCASVPDFEPRIPIDQAGSLREALLQCETYRVPPDADRPIVLRPFVDCVDQAAAAYPTEQDHSFRIFHQELKHRYDLLRDLFWRPELARELEVAIRAALRGLWQISPASGALQPPGYSDEELRTLTRYFPETSNELDVRTSRTARTLFVDRRLEALKAGVASLQEALPPSSPSQVAPDELPEIGALCRRLHALTEEARYLDSLWRDQQELNLFAPQDPSLARLRERYGKRLDSALSSLESLKSDFAGARQHAGISGSQCA